MQIAVTLYHPDDKITVPSAWGEYTIVAMREVRINGVKAKLLTLAPWNNSHLKPANFNPRYGDTEQNQRWNWHIT